MDFMTACVNYQKAVQAMLDAERAEEQAESTLALMKKRRFEADCDLRAALAAMNESAQELCNK